MAHSLRLQLSREGRAGRESVCWGVVGVRVQPGSKETGALVLEQREWGWGRRGGGGGCHPVGKTDALIWLNPLSSVQDPSPGNGTATPLWGVIFSTLIEQMKVILHRQAWWLDRVLST